MDKMAMMIEKKKRKPAGMIGEDLEKMGSKSYFQVKPIIGSDTEEVTKSMGALKGKSIDQLKKEAKAEKEAYEKSEMTRKSGAVKEYIKEVKGLPGAEDKVDAAEDYVESVKEYEELIKKRMKNKKGK